MSVLPPELMSAEEREARGAEVQREISREWIRFVIAEWVVIWIPLGIFGALYVATDLISDTLLVPVAIAMGAAALGLTLYWVLGRIRPLQDEQQRLEES